MLRNFLLEQSIRDSAILNIHLDFEFYSSSQESLQEQQINILLSKFEEELLELKLIQPINISAFLGLSTYYISHIKSVFKRG